MSLFGQRNGRPRRSGFSSAWLIIGLAVIISLLASLDGKAQQTAGLSIDMTVPSEVLINSTFDYALEVTNNGPDTARNVTVTDEIPNDVTFQSTTASSGCTNSGGSTYKCALGSIPSDGSASFAITVSADVSGVTVKNQATVTADQLDPNSADNTTTATTLIKKRATKTEVNCLIDSKAALVGQTVTCRATVTDTTGAGAPKGKATFSTSARSNAATFTKQSCNLTPKSNKASECAVSYTHTQIVKSGRKGTGDTITAKYRASTTRSASSGSRKVPFVKRPARVSVECTDGTTSQCTISVEDAGTRGTARPPSGVVVDPVDGDTCTLSGGQCIMTMDLTGLIFKYQIAKYQGSKRYYLSAGFGRAKNPARIQQFKALTNVSLNSTLSESSVLRDMVMLQRARQVTDVNARAHQYRRDSSLKALALQKGTNFKNETPTRAAAADLFSPMLEACRPAAKVLEKAKGASLQGLRTALNKTFDALRTAIDASSTLTTAIGNFLGAGIDLGFVEFSIRDIPFVGSVFEKIKKTINEAFNGIKSALSKVETLVGQMINRAAKTANNVIGLCQDKNPQNNIPDTFDKGNVLIMQQDLNLVCTGLSKLIGFGNIAADALASIPVGEAVNIVLIPVVSAVTIFRDILCVSGFDGQGLSPWLEVAFGLNPFAADSDGDKLPDAAELDMADGKMAAFKRTINPKDFPCPSPLIPDSDGDGLIDDFEDSGLTSKCTTDTDGDGANDGVELSTKTTPKFGKVTDFMWVCVKGNNCEANGQLPPLNFKPEFGPGPDTYFNSFDKKRMHADPLIFDTDGDGLPDEQEIGKSCQPVGSYGTRGPIINDADTDGDTLLDGDEKPITRKAWSLRLGKIQLGDSSETSSQNGWTNPCRADTDGDRLQDGEEFDLWGNQATATTFRRGGTGSRTVTTAPALDTDMDQDGLTESEETSATGTDPLHADSDGDKITDANELIATGSTPPDRSFRQVSDPLTRDTDSDGLSDNYEWAPTVDWNAVSFSDVKVGTGLGNPNSSAFTRAGGRPDANCIGVNNPDSDTDSLNDGDEVTEAQIAKHNGVWNKSWAQIRIGDSSSTGQGWTDPCNADTDTDGLQDAAELDQWSNQATATTFRRGGTGSRIVTTAPALDTDMDQETLSDFEEANTTGTDPLHADSDGDKITDANELIATSGTPPERSFRQVSDPLTQDTDSDGLSDNYEWDPTVDWDTVSFSFVKAGTGLGNPSAQGGFSGNADSACPLANGPDSEGDGLLDGDEVTEAQIAKHNGVWNKSWAQIRIGHSRSTGKGWTDPCNADTDADNLSDGLEVSNWGPEVDATLPSGTVSTVAALDDDMDQEGLSDFEEMNTIGSDPLRADNDGDNVTDANELIATGGSFPARSFRVVSNPKSQNADSDQLTDDVEWVDSADGLSETKLTAGTGVGTPGGSAFRRLGGDPDGVCPFVANTNSDNDGLIDGLTTTLSVSTATSTYKPAGTSEVTFEEGFDPIDHGTGRLGEPGQNDGHIGDLAPGQDARGEPGTKQNVCNRDADGDALSDGAEAQLGSDPGDWDTDNDGLPDNQRDGVFGQIPATNPLDPDSDDDGLIDGTEVVDTINPAAALRNAFVSNPTNPDSDADGLCDGGQNARTTNNLTSLSSTCTAGILDHRNDGSTPGLKQGIGEDVNADGTVDSGETKPGSPDTDGDDLRDGVEKLGFSQNRQSEIPNADARGRATRVTYPTPGCANPLEPDTDRDGLRDGAEDVNGDGHFNFEPSDFDWGSLDRAQTTPDQPTESNPCNADTDNDSQPGSVSRFGSAGGNSSDAAERERGTNPLDFDSDNDVVDDGVEVAYQCVQPDPQSDSTFRTVRNLDPLNQDSDADGIVDGLENTNGDARFDPESGETNPCASPPIPVVEPPEGEGGDEGTQATDSDGDNFPNEVERNAGTDPNDPNDNPKPVFADLDGDGREDNLLWMENPKQDTAAESVAIDMDGDRDVDTRIDIVRERDLTKDDFDDDGQADDCRYKVAFAPQPREQMLATITDIDCDSSIDNLTLEKTE